MKKLLFGLALAAIAVGGSSFTNAKKKTITENFLIQPISGIFIRAITANGSCLNLGGGLQCKYVVTDLGRWEIPSKVLYFEEDITEYLGNGWIEFSPTSNKGLYLII
jgi:ABC-type transport system involved in multi-copper enzyme maturation permease subunit